MQKDSEATGPGNGKAGTPNPSERALAVEWTKHRCEGGHCAECGQPWPCERYVGAPPSPSVIILPPPTDEATLNRIVAQSIRGRFLGWEEVASLITKRSHRATFAALVADLGQLAEELDRDAKAADVEARHA